MRFSVRYKILLVTSLVVLLAVATYLYLAVRMLERDKLAYIYDLNSALVETLSEESRSNLAILGEQLGALGRELASARETPTDGNGGTPEPLEEVRGRLAREAFSRNPDLLAVTLYEVGSAPAGGARAPIYQAFNDKLSEELAITQADFARVRQNRPLPLDAMPSLQLHVQNDSLPPEAPLLTVAALASERLVVAGTLRPSRLLRIFREAGRIYRAYLVDHRGVVLAHPQAKRVLDAQSLAEAPLVKSALSGKTDRGVREVEQAGQPVIGAYARVQTPRVAVIIEVPRAEALRGARELVRRSTLFAGAIVAAALMASVFLARQLTKPLRRLAEATRDVARGQYKVDLPTPSRDEIGDLNLAFVQMGRDLEDRERRLQEAQAQLVESAKLAAFGQLGAGITHEVKNPLTGIIGFAQIASAKVGGRPDGKAGGGKAGAGSPGPAAETTLDARSLDTVRQCVQGIEQEAKRCLEIVQNFLRFARRERVEFSPIDVNKVVEDAAKLVKHQLSVHGVRLVVETNSVPEVQANAGQLEQVLLNLMINAQQAMQAPGSVRAGERPTVTVRTSPTERGGAEIRVSDNGPGMPPEVRARIFEPFFTTKPKGEGTGLGLSVSYGIVRQHRGTIQVETEPGNGTTFVLTLPPMSEGPLSFSEDSSRLRMDTPPGAPAGASKGDAGNAAGATATSATPGR